MITRQEKINTIYNKIARKDLDFGCIVESKYWESIYLDTRPWQLYNIYRPNYRITDKEKEMKIIGHPVMIGDALDYIEENSESYKPIIWEKFFMAWIRKGKKIMILSEICLSFWKYKRLPLDDQPDKCIDFIYDLISK